MNILHLLIIILVFSIFSKSSESFTSNNCDTKKVVIKMVDNLSDHYMIVEPQSELFNIDDKTHIKSQLKLGKKGIEIAANLPGC